MSFSLINIEFPHKSAGYMACGINKENNGFLHEGNWEISRNLFLLSFEE